MRRAEELINRYLDEKLTRGIKNALGKSGGKKGCPHCKLLVPKYPGRYPNNCPECGKELEDLQNAPRYSEGGDWIDWDKWNAQMRRVPQDRIPLGGPSYYEL